MRMNQKVSLYIQEETTIALSWEINDKIVKVWVLEYHDLNGNVDLCEVTEDYANKGNIKTFIRKILSEGNYVSKNPMHFDTIGFESVCNI
jgi:hypothetical protein